MNCVLPFLWSAWAASWRPICRSPSRIQQPMRNSGSQLWDLTPAPYAGRSLCRCVPQFLQRRTLQVRWMWIELKKEKERRAAKASLSTRAKTKERVSRNAKTAVKRAQILEKAMEIKGNFMAQQFMEQCKRGFWKGQQVLQRWQIQRCWKRKGFQHLSSMRRSWTLCKRLQSEACGSRWFCKCKQRQQRWYP